MLFLSLSIIIVNLNFLLICTHGCSAQTDCGVFTCWTLTSLMSLHTNRLYRDSLRNYSLIFPSRFFSFFFFGIDLNFNFDVGVVIVVIVVIVGKALSLTYCARITYCDRSWLRRRDSPGIYTSSEKGMFAIAAQALSFRELCFKIRSHADAYGVWSME